MLRRWIRTCRRIGTAPRSPAALRCYRPRVEGLELRLTPNSPVGKLVVAAAQSTVAVVTESKPTAALQPARAHDADTGHADLDSVIVALAQALQAPKTDGLVAGQVPAPPLVLPAGAGVVVPTIPANELSVLLRTVAFGVGGGASEVTVARSAPPADSVPAERPRSVEPSDVQAVPGAKTPEQHVKEVTDGLRLRESVANGSLPDVTQPTCRPGIVARRETAWQPATVDGVSPPVLLWVTAFACLLVLLRDCRRRTAGHRPRARTGRHRPSPRGSQARRAATHCRAPPMRLSVNVRVT
jgi:hypothetical protein